MKRIIIRNAGRYLSHGIGYTEHDGYGGTSDNGWSQRMGIRAEERRLQEGERYQLEINGTVRGVFTNGAQ